MIIQLANDPLPYRPIRIIDVSPVHSSLRARPAGPSRWEKIRDRFARLRPQHR
jgi:hypothetical protein